MHRRAAAAISLSALPLHPGIWGINAGYAWSLPALVLAAFVLLRNALSEDVGRRAAPSEAMRAAAPFALALLLAAPALGAQRWRTLLAAGDAPNLEPWTALYGCARLARRSLWDTGPLLCGAGLAATAIGGRRAAPMAGAFLGGASGAWLGARGLSGMIAALRSGQAESAAALARVVPWSGCVAAVGAGLGWLTLRLLAPGLRARGGSALLLVGAVLASAWAGTPPLGRALDALASPASAVAVPEGAPGPSPALAAERPADPTLDARMSAQGHPPTTSVPGACLPATQTPWEHQLRATELLALPATARASDLFIGARTLLAHGVMRMGLLGHATPLPGPLGPWMSWPSAQFILDNPPADATPWFLDASGLHALDTSHRSARCALVCAPEVGVARLYTAGRSLGGPGGTATCRGAVALLIPERDPLVANAQWAAALFAERRCP